MPAPISFAATGDSFITRRLPDTTTLAAIRTLLAGCDARFTNFETLTPGPGAVANAISGGTWASAPDSVIPDLQRLGFNVFALATNHALDFLHAGLMATSAAFERHDAVVAGAGANLSEAAAPRYLETRTGRVALISVCSTLHETAVAGEQRVDIAGRPGINPLRFSTIRTLPRDDLAALATLAAASMVNSRNQMMVKEGFDAPPPPGVVQFGDLRFREGPAGGVITTARPDDVARVVAAISEARRQADRVVVSLHAHEQLGEDKAIAAAFVEVFSRACIDAGAHAVIGHGPHVLRGLELYKGHLIAYSLGNFATYGRFNLSGPLKIGAVLEVELAKDGKFARGKLLPTQQEGEGIPKKDPQARAVKLAADLTALDFPKTGVKVAANGELTP